MTIDPTSFGVSPLNPAASAPEPNALGKDDFLQLLVTSLRYQDPSEPMSTSELMAQTTQLSTMEQLTELTKLSQDSFALQMRTSAADLVGRQVTYAGADGETTTGVVSEVNFSTTPPSAVVNGAFVPMNLLSTVGAQGTGGATPPPEDDAAEDTPPTTPTGGSAVATDPTA